MTNSCSRSLSEILEQQCPYYLSIGMTYEEYWYGDTRMLRAFYQADKYRQERQNSEAWLQGMYFYDALSTALYNLTRKEGKPSAKYAVKPYDIGTRITKEKTQSEEQEATWALAYMTNMIQVGKQWGKK